MAGRLRTASRPSRTLILEASYASTPRAGPTDASASIALSPLPAAITRSPFFPGPRTSSRVAENAFDLQKIVRFGGRFERVVRVVPGIPAGEFSGQEGLNRRNFITRKKAQAIGRGREFRAEAALYR